MTSITVPSTTYRHLCAPLPPGPAATTLTVSWGGGRGGGCPDHSTPHTTNHLRLVSSLLMQYKVYDIYINFIRTDIKGITNIEKTNVRLLFLVASEIWELF